MRWLVLVAIAAACTAANPEFDRVGATDESGADPDEGLGSTDATGTADGDEEGGSSGGVAVCGPFEDARHVELRIDGEPQCGELYFAIGAIELVTEDELHFRCNGDPDSQCPPEAVAVLKNGWGFPPELVADPKRVMQMQYITTGDCVFSDVTMQVLDDVRLKFMALGPPAIFTSFTDYEVNATLIEMCECSNDCCGLPAGRYALEKSLVGEPVVLAEGEDAEAELGGAAYRFTNFASHVDANCEKTFHWQAVLL